MADVQGTIKSEEVLYDLQMINARFSKVAEDIVGNNVVITDEMNKLLEEIDDSFVKIDSYFLDQINL